jgi:phage terminase large subunit-like protein
MGPTEAQRQAVYARYGLTCPPAYATLRDFRRPTYGGKVAKIAAALGTPLMPWQRYTVDTALEIDPGTGLLVYRKVGLKVPRQSGKTSIVLPVAAHRGMAWQRQRIMYAAQSGVKAREKWEDEHVEALLSSKLSPRLRVRRANGREAIIWKATRSLHSIATNTEKDGHGKTLHLGMADEFFAQVDARIEAAWAPAMITVLSAQRWWLSAAGTSRSVPLNEETELGRALVASGEQTATCYLEWVAPDGADYTDPAVWLGCMPALCPTPPPCRCSPRWRHTVFISTIAAELESANTPAKLAEFLRAYLGWTRDDTDVVVDPHVPTVEAWELLEDARRGGTGLALAIDVTPLRDHAAICAAGEGPEGHLRRTAVLEHGPGIDWVVARAEQLNEQLKPVAWAIDEKSAAGELILPLEQAGFQRMGKDPARGQLWIPTTAELGASCGAFATAVTQGTLVHPGQAAMSVALGGARTRPLGDGSFAFARKTAAVDISPLYGSALALGAWERFRDLLTPPSPAAANTTPADGDQFFRPSSRLSL